MCGSGRAGCGWACDAQDGWESRRQGKGGGGDLVDAGGEVM